MAVDSGGLQGSSTACVEGQGEKQHSYAFAAANAALFRVVVGSSGDAAWYHAHTRVLWQQRTLAACMGPLLAALKRTPIPPAAAPAFTDAQGVPARSALLLVLASLLSCVPLAMLRNDAPRLVGPLLEALHDLPALAASCRAALSRQQLVNGGTTGLRVQALGSGWQEGAVPLLSELHMCLEGGLRVLDQMLLRSEQLRPLLENHVELLIRSVATLIVYPVRMRERVCVCG